MNETPEAVVREYFRAINESDAPGLAACFTEDGRLMADDFPTFAGRDTIEQTLAGMFQSVRIEARLEIENIREAGETAVALTRSSGAMTMLDSGTSTPHEHRELFVLRRSNGGWRIAHYMYNDPEHAAG